MQPGAGSPPVSLTASGQLLYDYQQVTGGPIVTELSDALFLSLGPCFLVGLTLVLRKHRRLPLRTFLLDVFSLGLVLLTLTLDLYLPRSGSMDSLQLARPLPGVTPGSKRSGARRRLRRAVQPVPGLETDQNSALQHALRIAVLSSGLLFNPAPMPRTR